MSWNEWTDVVGDVNFVAIFVGGLAVMAMGSVWYAKPLFGKTWQKLVGLSDKDVKSVNVPMLLGGTFVLSLLAGWGLAVLEKLLNVSNGMDGFVFGLFVGLLFVSTAMLTNFLYEQRSTLLWKINAGYATLALAIMASVIAIWR